MCVENQYPLSIQSIMASNQLEEIVAEDSGKFLFNGNVEVSFRTLPSESGIPYKDIFINPNNLKRPAVIHRMRNIFAYLAKKDMSFQIRSTDGRLYAANKIAAEALQDYLSSANVSKLEDLRIIRTHIDEIPNLEKMDNLVMVELTRSMIGGFNKHREGCYGVRYLSRLADKHNLAYVVLPFYCTVLEINTFLDCKNLKLIFGPNTLSIENGAVSCCPALVELCFPRAMFIKHCAFYNCPSLRSIELSPAFLKGRIQVDGTLLVNSLVRRISSSAFSKIPSDCQIRIGEHTTTLEQWVKETAHEVVENKEVIGFRDHIDHWISRYINNSATTIKDSGFFNSLATEVILPNLSHLEPCAFASCASLHTLTIPFNCCMEYKKESGLYSHFYNCPNLSTLILIWPSDSETGELKSINDIWEAYQTIREAHSHALTLNNGALILNLAKFLPDTVESFTGKTVYTQINNIYIKRWNGHSIESMPSSFPGILTIMNASKKKITISRIDRWRWVRPLTSQPRR